MGTDWEKIFFFPIWEMGGIRRGLQREMPRFPPNTQETRFSDLRSVSVVLLSADFDFLILLCCPIPALSC